jgi:hypothetical protein
MAGEITDEARRYLKQRTEQLRQLDQLKRDEEETFYEYDALYARFVRAGDVPASELLMTEARLKRATRQRQLLEEDIGLRP